MPVAKHEDGTVVVTGEAIGLMQMIAWRAALHLEILGIKRRGRPVSVIVRERFGWTDRSKQALFNKLNDHINKVGPELVRK